MRTTPEISVIVPFFQAERHIEACCEGLLRQTMPRDRYEVIMVDNRSTDRSAAIARQIPSISVIEEPERGSYAARNRGIRAARGSVLAFTDSDCVPGESWLSEIEECFRDSTVMIALGDRQFARNGGVLGLLAAYESGMATRTFRPDTRIECYYAYTNNMAVRRCVFDSVGEFDLLRRGADSLFLHKAIRTLGGTNIVRFLPRMTVRHLEIEGVASYLRKKLLYGAVTAANQERKPPQPLPAGERLRIARNAAKGAKPWSGAGFCAALAAGALAFEWARRTKGRSD